MLRSVMFDSITDVAGIRVGHYTDTAGITGCTVVLCEQGAVGGVDVSGAAPGTRETELLRPGNLVDKVQAVVLSGGSAFGLDAAGGVMKYLEERGAGHQTSVRPVPIVPAAIIFDLAIGDSGGRPGAEAGYQACLAASDGRVGQGSVGAGTGATVGKCLGMENATKGGLGMVSRELADGVVVAALMVVNAFGDVIDSETGKTIAGPRRPDGEGFLSTATLMTEGRVGRQVLSSNTVLGVVVTNAGLSKSQAGKLAGMAQVGVARSVDPCRTMYDGDVMFALSLGEKKADINVLGLIAARVVAAAIVRAVIQADTMGGIPSATEWSGRRA